MMPTSDSYYDSLINRLRDRTYAAGYLQTALQEDNPDPELLDAVLKNIATALSESQTQQQLDRCLDKNSCEAIYKLVHWLNELGLKLGGKRK